MSTFTRRLKEARLRARLSQEQLGIEAGIDPASASTRINRYELGKREPDLASVERLAEVLGVPVPYLYASDDAMAQLILRFASLAEEHRWEVLEVMEVMEASRES